MKSHVLSCPQRLVPCPNACGETLLPREIVAHRSTVCRAETVQCPQQETIAGCISTCQGEYRREDLEIHLNSPEYIRAQIQQISLVVLRQQEIINQLQVVTTRHEVTIQQQQEIITQCHKMIHDEQASVAQLQATVVAQVSIVLLSLT
jgi:4-hydroxy-3-methylbut-2-en-1-yl diphosphate synthase IspG/GcpE